jgi:hypothetical protein
VAGDQVDPVPRFEPPDEGEGFVGGKSVQWPDLGIERVE